MSSVGSSAAAWGRRYGAPAFLTGAALLVHWLPGAADLLEYRRAALETGEGWRVLSGHWTHGSLEHLAWDVLAFAVLGCGLARRSPAAFGWAVGGSALAISVVLFTFAPQWETYRGLSGIDSALFAALAARVWLEDRRLAARYLAAGALLLIAGKIVFELATGATLFAGDLEGLQVVPLAHLVGLATGLATAVGSWVWPQLSALIRFRSCAEDRSC